MGGRVSHGQLETRILVQTQLVSITSSGPGPRGMPYLVPKSKFQDQETVINEVYRDIAPFFILIDWRFSGFIGYSDSDLSDNLATVTVFRPKKDLCIVKIIG